MGAYSCRPFSLYRHHIQSKYYGKTQLNCIALVSRPSLRIVPVQPFSRPASRACVRHVWIDSASMIRGPSEVGLVNFISARSYGILLDLRAHATRYIVLTHLSAVKSPMCTNAIAGTTYGHKQGQALRQHEGNNIVKAVPVGHRSRPMSASW